MDETTDLYSDLAALAEEEDGAPEESTATWQSTQLSSFSAYFIFHFYAWQDRLIILIIQK